MMADVYDYILTTGVIVSDTGVINEEVITEYQQAFGSDLVTTPNTPQGVLITAETAARVAVADNNAALANQINPNVAGGVFLDAIGALTGTYRTPATPSTVMVSCTAPTLSVKSTTAASRFATFTLKRIMVRNPSFRTVTL